MINPTKLPPRRVQVLSFALLVTLSSVAFTLMTSNSLHIQTVFPNLPSLSPYHVRPHAARPTPASHRRLLQGKPRPFIVISAGLPRTGSTWLYNLLRVLSRLRDPDSVSGWMGDLKVLMSSSSSNYFSALRALNVSLVVKIHNGSSFSKSVNHIGLEAVDLVVTSHRDLRAQTSSSLRFFGGQLKLANREKWLDRAHSFLAMRDGLRKTFPNVTWLDVRYENWHGRGLEHKLKVVREMARLFPYGEYSEDELRDVLVEVERLRSPASSINPVTCLHNEHRRTSLLAPEFREIMQEGYSVLEKDPETSAFLRKFNYNFA